MANPKALFETLAQHDVNYLVVGKLSAALHGVPVVTESIEICPYDSRENNERLTEVLEEIEAHVQLEHGVVDTPISVDLLENGWRDLPAGIGHRFITNYGTVDVIYSPAGLGWEEEHESTI